MNNYFGTQYRISQSDAVHLKGKATLVDVAELAGVSKMTASRALRRAGDVSKRSPEKVWSAAERLGYVSNHPATSLSSQNSNLIGVVVPGLTNIVFAEVLSGLASGLDKSNIQPVFGVTDYGPDREYGVVRNMLSWRPNGLGVTGLEHQDRTRQLLSQADLPIVQIMDVDGKPIDGCVGVSHLAAGRRMAVALIQAGRKRFGYIGQGLEFDTRAMKRLEGFRQGLRENGIATLETNIASGPSTVGAGRSLTKRLL